MEKNLGFFEAWRAKRKEKKNEELEKLATMKVETGVLGKYLNMGNEDVRKSEVGEELKGVEVVSTAGPSKQNEEVRPTTCVDEKEKPVKKVELLKDSEKAPLKTASQDLRRNSLFTTAVGSRRSSFDFNSRRSSLISPITSFSGIQERILNLSQESFQNGSTPQKTVKVHKLSEDALKIGKQPLKDREESIKQPLKIGTNLQSKLTKFGATSTGSLGDKSAKENNLEKAGVKTKTTIGKAAGKNEKQGETTKQVECKEKEATEQIAAEAEKNDSSSMSGIKAKAESEKPVEKSIRIEKDVLSSSNLELEEDKNSKINPEAPENLQKLTPPAIKSQNELTKSSEGVLSTGSERNDKNKVLKAVGSVKAGISKVKMQKKETKKVEGDAELSKESSKGVIENNKKKIDAPLSKTEIVKKSTEPKASSQVQRKPSQKEVDGSKKSEVSKSNSGEEINKENESVAKIVKKEVKERQNVEVKMEGISKTQNKDSQTLKNEIQMELIEEAVKFQEGMTMLTNRANQLGQPETKNQIGSEDRSEASCISQDSGSESLSFRKDPKKLEKKLKPKSNPNECYPKSQKLLTNKPMNAFEQAKLEESRKAAVVSPSKVEAFLRDTLSPASFCGEKEPVKTMEAVVEDIVMSTSEKSKHEKPSKVRYTSRGEVICGVVSIKPSSKEDEPDSEGLSAITLVPAFRPEKSIFDDKYRGAVAEVLPEEKKVAEIPGRTFREEVEESTRDCFSPISDFSDDSYDHYVASIDYSLDSSYSRRRSLRSSSTPRRIFPQVVKPSLYRNDRTKEDSPVVFDAGLSFDIGSNRTSLRHRFKPQPAFTDIKTTSNSLSLRISDFLKRTDHIMEEWKHLGRSGGEDLQSLVQVPSSSASGRLSSSSRSATNIMIRGLLNYSKGSRTPSLRSRSLAKTSEASDRTISDIDELSEMTLDLSEERATGTMQAERLEAETAERVRLEQELSQVQSEKKNLQQTSERLEMELFYARADVNGLSESEADLEDGGGDAALYKNKCERAMRELEFTRRRLQQQHEDDLEQLVALKKQLEKKLADAYEEVEEQRQVAAQWKRKVQKLQSETNDLRLLLEEQSSRNNLLEKKQRKFDSEIQLLQEELRSERNQKERLSREKEMAVAEKYSMEQNLSSVRLELELKEEKVSALSREVEELSRGGGTEQEVTQLRKAKHDLDMKLKEQEEELDELAGQVSMLEGNKLRLEMSLESLRKEHRREMAQRDDELDEVRANAQKKIKVLESQLESEHEERTLLVREKHELERRLADAEERGRHHRAADEDALQRARRDLKKTKALLRDAQVMLERAKQDSPSKAALRALKNQLEDAELARASAVKAKQSLETELSEVSGQLEEALRAKGDSENRCQAAVREMNSLRTQVDENEEELAELLKKYRQTVQQLSAEQLANQETAGALAEAEAERASLRDQLAELTARLEANAVVDPISGLAQKKLEIRIKELESRLELEQTTRGRLEVQITRLKENMERLNEECVQARTKEQAATDLTRRLQRSLREAKEELAAQQAKDQEALHKRKELEKRLETAESEAATARTDLRLAVKRIEDLQSAISGDIGSDSDRTESDEDDSENDSLVSHVPSTLSSTSRTSRTPELTPR